MIFFRKTMSALLRQAFPVSIIFLWTFPTPQIADIRLKKYSEDYQTLIHADIELKSSVARAKFIPEDFSYLDIYDTSYPKEEVYIQMTDFFDEFINEINSVFASSGCGLSVKDFGFKLF